MSNSAPRTLGWKRIWVICYQAKNGKWYPASSFFYPLRMSAEQARKESPEGLFGKYKVLPYRS